MAWQVAGAREVAEVLSFLKIREWGCVSLSSRLLSGEGGSHHLFVNRAEGDRRPVTESLLVTPNGLVLPAIDPAANPTERYHRELRPLIEASRRRIHSIMGLQAQVGVIESLLDDHATERIQYHLMTHEYFSVERPCRTSSRLTVRKASIADLAALFPLQRDYEREEVLVDPDSFNPAACLLSLQHALRKEIVYVAQIDGSIVAKAATNAQGLSYFQIGGVYTLPSHRNQGVARELLLHLMWEIAQQRKHLCLFVKKHNAPALALYRGLGFANRDGFTISYFRS